MNYYILSIVAICILLPLVFIWVERLGTAARCVAITVTLALAVTSYFVLDYYKSMPYLEIEGQHTVLHHQVRGEKIFIWAIPEWAEEPRTFNIPYNEKLEEALNGKKNGRGELVLNFKGDEGEGEGGQYKRQTIAEDVELQIGDYTK